MAAKFTAVLFVQVRPEMLGALDHLAEIQGTSRSHEVRAAVRERLARFGPLDELERDSLFLTDVRERTVVAGGDA